MKKFRLHLPALAAALLCSWSAAHADIQVGDGTVASTSAGKPLPELVLVIWDRTAKISYTKDLGVTAYASSYAVGDTSKNLFVYGQQNAGYQVLFPSLNTDSNFQAFLSSASGAANMVWAVMGVELNEDAGGFGAGAFTMFTTLNSGTAPNGTTNPAYFDFVGKDAAGNPNTSAHFNNSELSDATVNFSTWLKNNNDNRNNLTNTHRCALTPSPCSGADAAVVNGSSFDVESSSGYALNYFGAAAALVANGHGNVLNPVGKSSWFYRATLSSDVSDESILVDEFDNEGHDAYWGLGVNAQGEYILSYTLQASLTQTQTVQGQMLRLRTDFAANYGSTRFIGAPVGDTLNLGGGTAITPVPEPSTWGLMGLGLALLAGRARRQKNA